MRNYLKFVSMLAIALAVLLVYALLPAEVADELHLKQVGLSALSADKGQSLEDLLAGKEGGAQDSTQVEPTDTTRQRVLMFGDSMTGLLGARFADYAKQNGHEFLCVTWNSSSTPQWAKSDTLDHYMRAFRPTHVFVCLGSNELYTKDEDGRKKYMEMIKRKVGDVPFIWIGPPNWKEDSGYNQWILDVMGPKAYYPSLKLTFERQKDGAHPTPASGAMWMDKVVEWMNAGHSVHPFRLAKTSLRHSYYRQVIIPASGKGHVNPTHTDGDAEAAGAETITGDAATTPDAPAAEGYKSAATEHKTAATDRKPAADDTHADKKPQAEKPSKPAPKAEPEHTDNP